MSRPPSHPPDPATAQANAQASTPLDTGARARCAATADWLRAALALEWLALLIAVAALWLLLSGTAGGALRWAAWAALALALPERVLALRLRFDRRLFAGLADGRIASLGALDAALSAWRRATPGPPRTLDARIAGTLGLWRRHAAVVAVQALLCLIALAPSG